MEAKNEYSLKNVLSEVFDIIVKRGGYKYRLEIDENMSAEDIEDARRLEETYSEEKNSNFNKKFYEIIDGLYCYKHNIKKPIATFKINRKKWTEPKPMIAYNIKINEFTKCIIIALMTMPSSSQDSFISKVRNHRFSEITYKDKLDYILAVKEELKNIKLSQLDSLITDHFVEKFKNENLDATDKELLDKEFKKEISKALDSMMFEFQSDRDIITREDELKDTVVKKVDSVIRELFPNYDIEELPYPTCKAREETEQFKRMAESGHKEFNMMYLFMSIVENLNLEYEIPDSPTEYLSSAEKEHLLDSLENELIETIENWKAKATEALQIRNKCEADYIWELI